MFGFASATCVWWLVLAGGLCGCRNDDGDGGPDGGTDAGTDDTNPTDDTDRPVVGERFEITLDPSLSRRMSWPSATVPMSGRVLDLDGVGMPAQLDWVVAVGGSSSSGVGTIDLAGTWTADVPLTAGDNAVTVSIPGTPAVLEVEVSHNDGYVFGGTLTLTETVAYVGEPRTLQAEIRVTDPDTDPLDVTLVQVDELGQEAELVTLVDTGDALLGDVIGGDLLFHGSFEALGSTVGETLHYRVVVTRLSGGSARSELRDVRIHDHIDPVRFAAQIEAGRVFRERLTDATPDERPSVLEDIHNELAADPTVAVVDFNDSHRGVWFVYDNGVAGVVDIPVDGEKAGSGGVAAAASPMLYQGDEVGSSRAKLIASQFWDWGEDEVGRLEDALADQGCVDVDAQYDIVDGLGNVEEFMDLSSFGLVVISTHGDSFFDTPGDWLDEFGFGWNGPFGQVIVDTNHAAIESELSRYEDDLVAGRLVLSGHNFGITPAFVRHYVGGRMPYSLVYVSACRSAWNGSMAGAFLESGAGAYLGYSDYVGIQFAADVGFSFLDAMLVPGTHINDAFAGEVETTTTDVDPAQFTLYGDIDLELDLEGIQDGGFESGDQELAWGGGEGASTVSAWYTRQPTEGNYMALVTTGFGELLPATLSQSFCLEPSDHTLVFDYNLFTECPFFGCGPDHFAVIIQAATEEPPYYLFQTVLFIEPGKLDEDDLEAAPGVFMTLIPCSLEPEFECVWTTGWQTFTYELGPEWLDSDLTLTFKMWGAVAGETAVLVDNIHFVQ